MKRILTGLQVTADQFHLGNYFGAVKPMIDLAQQEDHEMFLFVATMHSFTQLHDPVALQRNTLNTIKLLLACAPEPDTFFIYNPVDVPAHAQLTWVIQCLTHMGAMERMHAFKSKIQDGKAHEASIGLFAYPMLMAADILLYDADVVPVGQDQKQHLEFTRDFVQKFHNMFDEDASTFVLPTSRIQEEVAVVPGIDGRKMSKSYNNFIGLLQEEKVIRKKIRQIATDTIPIDEPKDPDACNVYNILKLFLTPEENTRRRSIYTQGGLSYKDAKNALFERVRDFVIPLQKRFEAIGDQEVVTMLARNAERANSIAKKKIQLVYEHIGFSL